jgi:hypothetical protein
MFYGRLSYVEADHFLPELVPSTSPVADQEKHLKKGEGGGVTRVEIKIKKISNLRLKS